MENTQRQSRRSERKQHSKSSQMQLSLGQSKRINYFKRESWSMVSTQRNLVPCSPSTQKNRSLIVPLNGEEPTHVTCHPEFLKGSPPARKSIIFGLSTKKTFLKKCCQSMAQTIQSLSRVWARIEANSLLGGIFTTNYSRNYQNKRISVRKIKRSWRQ